MTGPLTIRIASIRRDGGTQIREGLSERTVEQYTEDIESLPPIYVYREAVGDEDVFWLADGFHRVEAHLRAGRDMMDAHVVDGTRRDAIRHACGANADHGLRRSQADGRRAVEKALSDEEWRTWSDSALAKMCRVSDKTVARVRAEIGAHAEVRKYTRNGVEQEMRVPTAQPRNSEVAAPAAPTRATMAHDARADRVLSAPRPPRADADVQQPEPDNVVRKPVEREKKGRELTEGDKHGMRALAAVMPREKLAERFRVELHVVDEILGGATPAEDRATEPSDALSQWWTPPELAALLVQLADVQPGDTVLEPAAGAGRIVEAIVAAGAAVEAHELDPRMVAVLNERWPGGEVDVYEGDYLGADLAPVPEGQRWAFKRCVFNPPYENGLDGKFLARVLDEAEVVVALVRLNILCSQGRYELVWSKHAGRLREIRPIVIRPDFNEGRVDGGDGAKSDFVVLVFDGEDRGPSAPLQPITERFLAATTEAA